MSDLPTGTVTFLMTDIEGSTRAWQASPETLTPAIVAHYAILDEVIAEHGGARPEEQGEGDSVVAVFTDAAAAVAAAVSAQRRLRAELPALGVRMALHTGEAIRRDERNYVGLTIIRCARIRSSGHGGQILVSDATADTVAGALPAETELLDLGRYGLRGLRGRERIWQVRHPELAVAFPPLSAGASSAGNLPAPVSSFVGRRRELVELSDLVDHHRLVTLTGPPAIGKSRLALAAAGGVANSFGGGAWWIALPDRGAGSAASVSELTAAACAVDDPLAHFRVAAEALIVLDGADRWCVAVTEFASDLLGRCPDVRLLVTARAPLGLPGEHVHPLDALDPDDAEALFAQRHRAAGGAPDDVDTSIVAELCRRLHGIPGAFELAAPRAATTSLAHVVAGLDEVVGAGASLAASPTTPSVWGLHLIDDTARAVLERLTVFRAPFSSSAAVAVVADREIDAARVSGALRDLVGQHLVEPMGDLLRVPERVRVALGSRPDPAAWTGVADRHARWFVARAEEFDAAGLDLPTSWIADEFADVLAALAHAREHDPKLAHRILAAVGGRWRELRVDGAEEALASSAAWLAGRSPSDGELVWAAAVARLSFATAGDSDSPVHGLEEEALAIAELDHDEVSQAYLAYRPAITGPADHDALVALAARAARVGAAPVAAALASLTAAQEMRS